MLIDCHNHIGADLYFYLNGHYPYAQDLVSLTTEGARHGVTHWIVFPMVAHSWFDINAMRAGRLLPGGPEKVPYAFENERMLREIYQQFPDPGRRTIPFAMLDPMREPEAQVATLRGLMREFPFHGLKIQGTMTHAHVTALLKEGRCFLEFAEENNLPFLIHSSVWKSSGGIDPWSQALDIIRIAESAPRVRFCLAHSCRYDRVCLDRVAELPNTWFDCSAHRIHCKGVVNGMGFVAGPERRFATDYNDPKIVLRDLAAAYPTKLLWGSDTPFQSFVCDDETEGLISLRSTYEEEIDCVRALSPDAQARVGCRNILDFLQLKNEQALLPLR